MAGILQNLRGGEWRELYGSSPVYLYRSGHPLGINGDGANRVARKLISSSYFGAPDDQSLPTLQYFWEDFMFKIFRKNCCSSSSQNLDICCIGITDTNGRTGLQAKLAFLLFPRSEGSWLHGLQNILVPKSVWSPLASTGFVLLYSWKSLFLSSCHQIYQASKR